MLVASLGCVSFFAIVRFNFEQVHGKVRPSMKELSHPTYYPLIFKGFQLGHNNFASHTIF